MDMGWHCRPERVDDVRVGFVLDGSACWLINRRVYRVAEGDVIIVLPGAPCSSYVATPIRFCAARLRFSQAYAVESTQHTRSLPEWLLSPATIHIGTKRLVLLFALLLRARRVTAAAARC